MRKVKKIKRKEVSNMMKIVEDDDLSIGVFVAGVIIGGVLVVSAMSGFISWLASGPLSGPLLGAAIALKSQGK